MSEAAGGGVPDLEIDARGLLCPLPVLKARKVLAGARPGTVLLLRASDPAAWVDVPHFCAEAGHHLIEARGAARDAAYVIRCGQLPCRDAG